jgi:hypothetical protein
MISKNIISNESQGYEISSHVIFKIEFIFQNLFPSCKYDLLAIRYIYFKSSYFFKYKLLSINIIFIFILLEIL